MDTRIFHIAFEHALQTVAWERHGENEYVQIGDGTVIDPMRLQSLIDQTFSDSTLWLSPDRHQAVALDRAGAGLQIARLMKDQAITVANEAVGLFLQAHPLCIARTGRAQANKSFKPNPLRGSA